LSTPEALEESLNREDFEGGSRARELGAPRKEVYNPERPHGSPRDQDAGRILGVLCEVSACR